MLWLNALVKYICGLLMVGILLFLHYPALIAMRIRNEEQVLEKGLPGYADYMKKVKYRLVPFVW